MQLLAQGNEELDPGIGAVQLEIPTIATLGGPSL